TKQVRDGLPKRHGCRSPYLRERQSGTVREDYSAAWERLGRVRLPWVDLAGRSWRLTDPLQVTAYDRAGDELQESGCYADLEPWG
ncbi:MAG TPA: hypothetical protein VES92_05635, partial [Nitrospiraceae bacterium]|nr:hypothetical protein [Nitrospiraceae bacterium]